jgi:putative ABC transport system ATP-binding protein
MPETDASNQKEHAVHATGLRKAFSSGDTEVVAVDGVDFDAAPGELTMIVGPSGCGKTTLLSLIAGVLDPDEGEVEVFGAKWKDLSGRKATRTRGEYVGFVFQAYNLIPTLTAEENAAVPALIQGASRSEAFDRARDALESVGLADRAGARPGKLSGGMMQRVAIARALVADAPLLVCDEPTANLDAKTGASVMDLLTDICESEDDEGRRRAVLAVTHDQRIFPYADIIHEMDDGRITGAREPDEEPPDPDELDGDEQRANDDEANHAKNEDAES